MFQGDQTNDHFSSREGSFSLSFFVSLHFHFNPFFLWVSFHFTFSSIFFLRSSTFGIFWTFGFLVSPTFFLGLKLYAARLLKIYTFVILRVSLFQHLPFSVKADPWSGFRKKNHQVQKGKLLDNFLYQWRDNQRWSFFISNLAT